MFQLPLEHDHDAVVWGAARMRCVFAAPTLAARLPASCCSVRVSPRLRRALDELDPSFQQPRERAARVFLAEVRDSGAALTRDRGRRDRGCGRGTFRAFTHWLER